MTSQFFFGSETIIDFCCLGRKKWRHAWGEVTPIHFHILIIKASNGLMLSIKWGIFRNFVLDYFIIGFLWNLSILGLDLICKPLIIYEWSQFFQNFTSFWFMAVLVGDNQKSGCRIDSWIFNFFNMNIDKEVYFVGWHV